VPPPVAAAATGTGPALEAAVVDELRGLSPTAAPEAFSAFVRTGRERMDRLRAAAAAGDDAGWREQAHALKGASGAVGAMRLAALLDTAQKSTAGDALPGIESEYEKVMAEI